MPEEAKTSHEQTSEREREPKLPNFAPLPNEEDAPRIVRQLLQAGYIEAAWMVTRMTNALIGTKCRLEEAEEKLDRIGKITSGVCEDE